MRRLLLAVVLLALAAPAAAHAAVGDELLTNPGAEQGSTGWTMAQWGNNTASFTTPTTDFHSGSRSFRIDMSNWSSGDAKWIHTNMVPITGGGSYQFSDWYRSNVGTRYVIYWEDATDVPGADTGQWMILDNVGPASTWTQHTMTVTMPPTAVRAYPTQLIETNGFLGTDDYSFRQVPPDAGFSRAMVSLTYDDSWSSQYNTVFAPGAGTAHLDSFGFKATEYVIADFIGDSQRMTAANIRDMDARGHDIESHTETHPDLTTLSPSQLTAELSGSQQTLQTLLGHAVNNSFAYPFGEYNDTVINATKQYYAAGRSVDEGYNTLVNTDLYRLKVQNVLNTTTAADVQTWVNAAKAGNYWLILVTHDVQSNPTQYGTTPTKMDQMLAVIKNSGVAVLTMKAALAESVPQLGGPPPPLDTDGDGIPDSSDACPMQPGPPSNNGCPVVTAPALSVTPASLSFTATAGGTNPAAKELSVTNTGGGTMNWTASDDQSWMSVSPSSGPAPGTITVTPSITGLTAGTYQGTVTVTAAGATGSPKTIPVTLTVNPQPPVDQPPTVTINTPADGASYPRRNRVLADYSCADDKPGVSCVGTVPNGAPISTNPRGIKTFRVTARDNATPAHVVTKTVTYRVV
jgi:peptidoglycan/xylan/chitin deacetylase (PgdA/CDA1 family)